MNNGDSFINKNLLKINLPIFSYVFKLDLLFPPILKKNIIDLSNKAKIFSLPINCAVDDLEIYNDDNDQIYDLMNNPQFYSAGSADYLDQYHHQTKEFNFKYELVSQPVAINPMVQPSGALDSHFNLNMIGTNQYFFNDFKPHGDSTDQYSSSNESYISPLDEELFKKRDYRDVHHNPSLSSVEFDLKSEINEYLDITVKSEINDFQLEITDLSELMEFPSFSDKKRRKSNKFAAKKVKLEDDNQDEDQKFECKICNARFKVKGYLTRHIKKHQLVKSFRCPFYTESQGQPNGTKGTKCHPTGGFSRRDTFKTHLKALHFIYPPGTKSNERTSIGGRCAGCFKFYNSNVDWLENHIEKHECSGTVSG